MELTFAVLCQGAVQQASLVTIVGAGADNFQVPTLPAAVNAAVAFNFKLDRNDMQQPHTVSVGFIDEDGTPMPGLDIPEMQVPANPNAPIDPQVGLANLNGIVNLNAVQVHRPGRYAADLRFDGKAMKRIPFHVIIANGQSPQPPGPSNRG